MTDTIDRILTWEQRLDQRDTSKGVSNVMRQDCMKEEIAALRLALRAARKARDEWKETALRYRSQILLKD